jgi:hypothetical protein
LLDSTIKIGMLQVILKSLLRSISTSILPHETNVDLNIVENHLAYTAHRPSSWIRETLMTSMEFTLSASGFAVLLDLLTHTRSPWVVV